MNQSATALEQKSKSSFFRKGVSFAILSGIAYGLFTSFLTLAETQGIWGDWFGEASALSAFAVMFVLASLASGINDLLSGIWSLIFAAGHGQLGDFKKAVATKPGIVMMICAIIGGPGGATLYVVALNMATAAGSPGIIVPVAALNVAVGAILSRIFFKQELNARMILGIVICLVCCAIIGQTSFSNIGPNAIIACLFAFGAAICWGFEGCVAGFGTALIDYNIGITIRQLTSGIVTLFLLVPILCVIGGDGVLLFPKLLGSALTDPTILIFIVSAFFAMFAYSLWYKGNSMCGTALGMACNGMYAFWGPLFIWIVNGVLNLGGMAASYPPLMPVQWIAAFVMAIGIFVIATNPFDLFKRNKETEPEPDATRPRYNRKPSTGTVTYSGDAKLPLSYAIYKYCTYVEDTTVPKIMEALAPSHKKDRQFKPAYIQEVLMTGSVNGLLDETGYDLDLMGNLRDYYKINDYGREMVEKYIS